MSRHSLTQMPTEKFTMLKHSQIYSQIKIKISNKLNTNYLQRFKRASQAEGHEFEPRLPLKLTIKVLQINVTPFFVTLFDVLCQISTFKAV